MPELKTGIVLSGGGMRGAYEVGVVSGIMRALGRRREDPGLFQIFTGSSVGAINAAFLAANAHRGDPLGGMAVSTQGFARMAAMLGRAAREICPGRLVLTLEGGYHPGDLAECLVQVMEQLRDPDGGADKPAPGAGMEEHLARMRSFFAPYWPALTEG